MAGSNKHKGEDPATCAGCKQPMLDMDGKPRPRRSVMHCCSQCFEFVHFPTVCDQVWMPIPGG
eukprot:695974-Pleurochrysis_carterae.AAC.1